MSDLIDRQETIQAIQTWDKFGCDERSRLVPWRDGLVPYVHLEDVVFAISNMPSAEPERKWIPCSERLPFAEQTLCGYKIEYLIMIANILKKENLPPERLAEALTDMGRVVAIVRDEFEETLRQAVEQMRDLISRQAAIDACLIGKTDGLPATNAACDCGADMRGEEDEAD